MRRQRIYRSLYFQVLVGIAAGALFGFLAPARGAAMQPLGDGFIKLVKMLIAPIVFTTVVVGIAQMGAMKDVGRIGLRALVYFEVVSTLALVIGLVVVDVLQPGSGLGFNPAALDVQAVAAYTDRVAAADDGRLPAERHPEHGRRRLRARRDPAGAAVLGAVRPGAAPRGASACSRWSTLIEQLSHALFAIVGMIMRLAPIGAFGAMAFTVGRYGIGTLLSLGKLMAGVYLTCAALHLRRARRDRAAARASACGSSCATSARRS